MIGRTLTAAAVAVAALVLVASPAAAHPLGNFTVNTAAALVIAPDGVRVDVAVDLAEIPSLQVRDDIDRDGDGTPSRAEQNAYRDAECARVADQTQLRVDDREVALAAAGSDIAITGGAAGLSTIRMTCALTAPVDLTDGARAISYVSRYASGRVGWHEVSARGDAMVLDSSDVPTISPSALLTDYPDTTIASPPDVRSASMRARPGGPRLDTAGAPSPAVHSTVPGVDRATRSFAGLVTSRELTVRLGLLSVLVAFVLGAFHAVAPGHGKTVMAAYLVGQRGTLRQALGVGAGVTLTHTAGVLVLGLVLSVSTVTAPERVFPWLGLASGLLLASIGAALLLRARRLRRLGIDAIWHSHAPGGHGHVHTDWAALAAADTVPAAVRTPVLVGARATLPHASPHDHGAHDHGAHDHGAHDHGAHDHGAHDHGAHDHVPHGHHHEPHDHHAPDREPHDHVPHDEPDTAEVVAPGPAMGWRWIVAMGFAGGMVPSPSALVVLLGAVALGRTWFGVALVLAYGIGMAATLVVAGLLLVRARVRIEQLVVSERGRRAARLLAVLPMLTAVVIVFGGIAVAGRAIASM